MIKAHKIEFFPDMVEDGPYGPCALVLHFYKPNSKRFKKMNEVDKVHCRELITQFQRSLQVFKKSIK